jgi:Flp pilus assembly protein TadG
MIPGIHSKKPGQSLVEFALMLPILLVLVLMIFDFGRAIYYYSALHNAAREGARYGAVHPDDNAGMKSAAIDYAIGFGLTPADICADLGPTQPVGGFNNPTVQVIVTMCFTPVTPLLSNFLSTGCPTVATCNTCTCTHVLLVGDSIMRTEALPSP